MAATGCQWNLRRCPAWSAWRPQLLKQAIGSCFGAFYRSPITASYCLSRGVSLIGNKPREAIVEGYLRPRYKVDRGPKRCSSHSVDPTEAAHSDGCCWTKTAHYSALLAVAERCRRGLFFFLRPKPAGF